MPSSRIALELIFQQRQLHPRQKPRRVLLPNGPDTLPASSCRPLQAQRERGRFIDWNDLVYFRPPCNSKRSG